MDSVLMIVYALMMSIGVIAFVAFSFWCTDKWGVMKGAAIYLFFYFWISFSALLIL